MTPSLHVLAARLSTSRLPMICSRTLSTRNRPLRIPRPSDALQTSQELLRPHHISLFPGDYSSDYQDAMDEEQNVSSNDEQGHREDFLEKLRELEAENQKQKERWLRNSEPPVRVPVIDHRGRSYGRGARKTASARVWIQPGMGTIWVNQQPFDEYFKRQSDREHVLQPFIATETCGKFDAQVIVKGGGLTGQAGAARLGVARALNHYNPDDYRPPLKKLGMLERDARKVERKKIGRKKARKSPQWVRR